MVLMNGREYGRAISILEDEAKDEARPVAERIELCQWLAECNRQLEDQKASGDWYLEAVRRVLSQRLDLRTRARQALPFAQKALEAYKQGGEPVDILEAGKLKQRLLDLAQ